MAIERRVTELAGQAGKRLHTARSRNDQVATDVAMFVRDHAERCTQATRELMAALLEPAERHVDWAMPGYTHLQRAQPVYLSHHLLAYFWMFARDVQRLEFARQAARSPAAGRRGAGRRQLPHRPARRWPRSWASPRVAENSIDAVSNRDFVLDFLSAAATCATHLSRLGAEIVLWSSEEFGFCQVADAFASGSSIMPQKKNPDAAELLRAKAPRRGRPPGRAARRPPRPAADLQQGPAGGQGAPVRRRRHAGAVPAAPRAGCSRGSSFDRERLAAAAADEFLGATDVADLLVRARRAVPRGPRRSSAGLVRARAGAGARAVRAVRRRSWPSTRRRWTGSSTRSCGAERWLESQGLGGRHGAGRACASSSTRARAAAA